VLCPGLRGLGRGGGPGSLGGPEKAGGEVGVGDRERRDTGAGGGMGGECQRVWGRGSEGWLKGRPDEIFRETTTQLRVTTLNRNLSYEDF